MKTAIVLRSVRGSQTTGQIQVEVIVLWMQRPPPLPLRLNRGSKLNQLPQCTLEITPPAALTGWKRDGSLWFLYSELQSLLNLSQFNFHEQSDMSARPGLFGWTRDEDGSKLRSPMDEGNRYTDCSRPGSCTVRQARCENALFTRGFLLWEDFLQDLLSITAGKHWAENHILIKRDRKKPGESNQ